MDGAVGPNLFPSGIEIDAPVDADYGPSIESEEGEEGRISGPKIDERNGGDNGIDESAHVGEEKRLVVARSKAANPRIEELNDLSPGSDLFIQVERDRIGEFFHEDVPGGGIAIHHLFGEGEVTTASPFDHVAGEGEGGSRKADNRYGGWEGSASESHRIGNELERFHAGKRSHAIDIAGEPERVVDDGAVPWCEFEMHAHRLEDGEQIGEDDGRIDADALHGGDHDFRAELRVFAEF